MTKQLSKEGLECLEVIREKVQQKSATMTAHEVSCLGIVHKEVCAMSNLKVSEIIKASCQGCVMQAVKIVYSYITYHQPATLVKKETVVFNSGKDAPKKPDQMSVKELIAALKEKKVQPPRNASKATLIDLLTNS